MDFSEEVRARLDTVLPITWSKLNPVDIIGDADAVRYETALEILASDSANDAVLVINVPTALASATDTANAIVRFNEKQQKKDGLPKPLFSVWLGAGRDVSEIFDRARIPHYPTETDAVRGFMHLVHHSEAATALMEAPPSLPETFAPDTSTARRVVMAAAGSLHHQQHQDHGEHFSQCRHALAERSEPVRPGQAAVRRREHTKPAAER